MSERLLIGCVLFAVACGGAESDPNPSAQAGAGGSAPSGGAGQGGVAAAGAAAAGAGGAGQAGCVESVSTFELVITGAIDRMLASPSVGPGELELFYVEYEASGLNGHFMQTTRSSTSVGFAPATAVPELDAACQAADLRSIDLSLDGLRAYLLCFPTLDAGSFGTLRVATRPSPTMPFVLDAQGFGQVGASPAVAADELSIYSSSEQGVALMPLMVYSRNAAGEAFANGMAIPGLETELLSTPDIGPDNLHLYAGLDGRVVMSTRSSPDSVFGPSTTLVAPTVNASGTPIHTLGAPEAAPDCRSIYWIEVLNDGTGYNILRAAQ